MKKSCNNHCGMNWCCSGESFMSNKKRWDRESVEFSKLKGVRVFEGNGDALIVHVNCPCCNLKAGGCIVHGLLKPNGCSHFPTAEHDGAILTEKCLYFDKNKHISFEKLKPYEPEA